MDIDALSQSPVGRLVPVRGRDARHGDFAYFAFLPTPLPDDVVLRSASWAAVAMATAALARLDQACDQLPDPRLLIRPALWREALDTSALEGTVAPLQDVLEAQLGGPFLSPQAQEISAYVDVALRAFDVIRDRAVSVSLLCVLQQQLFQDLNNRPEQLGQVREQIVWIGSKDRPIYEARFVPPPGDDRLRAGLDVWEEWVQADRDHLPPVLRAALSHYQLETLHPFTDGNGRIGRLVVVLQLLRAGCLRQPAITVSPWLLRHRTEYQNELLKVSSTGQWDDWIQLFCEALCAQSESLIKGAIQLRDWLEQSRQVLHAKRWTGKIHLLLESLIEWPVTSVARTAQGYDTSIGNATRMIEHLVEVGILEELTGKSYGRIFGNTRVMAIVDSI
jgi:Fic family protein